MTQNSNPIGLYQLMHSRELVLLGVRRSGVTTNKGFTLVELILVLALIGILATMSVPLYNNYTDKAKNAAAISDIGVLSNEITAFSLDHNYAKPLNLGEIGRDKLHDPWKRNYEYRSIGVLKDEYGVLLNGNSFDVFSKGKNGDTADVGGVPETKDDIARMGNGNSVGMRDILLP
jgi:prepilin-type N-terminal cleavage/methylation domain-containing protein